MKKFLISALATGLLLTACSPGDVESPTPVPSMSVVEPTPSPSPTASEEPSPTPSPEPTSTLSPDQQAAVETVLEYFRVGDEIRSDMNADFQPLADLTTGEVTRLHFDEISENRSEGIIQTGVVDYQIIGVYEPVEVDGQLVVTIEVCSDSSASDLVDVETRESVLGADRASFVYWVLDVVHVDGFQWRVGDGGSEVRDPCL